MTRVQTWNGVWKKALPKSVNHTFLDESQERAGRARIMGRDTKWEGYREFLFLPENVLTILEEMPETQSKAGASCDPVSTRCYFQGRMKQLKIMFKVLINCVSQKSHNII